MKIRMDDVDRARQVLELPERASMQEIKDSYKRLISLWHPDTCTMDKEKCQEMTRRIIEAYSVIRHYCSQYEYSFSRQEVERYISREDWWKQRFGDDPLWSSRS